MSGTYLLSCQSKVGVDYHLSPMSNLDFSHPTEGPNYDSCEHNPSHHRESEKYCPQW